jgi:hypothetical protein
MSHQLSKRFKFLKTIHLNHQNEPPSSLSLKSQHINLSVPFPSIPHSYREHQQPQQPQVGVQTFSPQQNQQQKQHGPQPASIDVSELFPSHLGTQPALAIFRINTMQPELVRFDREGVISKTGDVGSNDETEYRFCVYDCYIIVKTSAVDAGGAVDADSESEAENEHRSGSDDDSGSCSEDFDMDQHSQRKKLARDRLLKLQGRRQKLRHQIWTWIGCAAETDKMFCCAMYAVGLRKLSLCYCGFPKFQTINYKFIHVFLFGITIQFLTALFVFFNQTLITSWVGSSGKITRETQGEESQEFLDLFANGEGCGVGEIMYDESPADAAESGLYITEERVFSTHVYHVHAIGRLRICMTLCNLNQRTLRDVLSEDKVLLVDCGLEIFVWCGRSSGSANRKRLWRSFLFTCYLKILNSLGACILAESINAAERVSRASVFLVEQDSEPDHFWDAIGCDNCTNEISDDTGVECPTVVVEDEYDNYFSALALRPARLYQAPILESDMASDAPLDSYLIGVVCLTKKIDLPPILIVVNNTCRKLISMLVELYGTSVLASSDHC